MNTLKKIKEDEELLTKMLGVDSMDAYMTEVQEIESPFGDAISEKDVDDIYRTESQSDNIITFSEKSHNTKKKKDLYIDEDYNVMWEDLKKMHPLVGDKDFRKKYGNVALEIRALKRDFRKSISIPIFNFSNESKKVFINWYKSHIKHKCFCMYTSMFMYYPDMVALKEDGAEYDKFTCNQVNMFITKVLVLDFDHISVEENKKFDCILKDLGLSYDSIRTNSNGWQKRFYLSDFSADKKTVKKFTNLALSRGFNVDAKLDKSSQVVRIKGSVNNKCFMPDTDRIEQYKVVSEIEADCRMDLADIWDRISSLPVVNADIVVEPIIPELPKNKKEIKTEISKKFYDIYSDIVDDYLVDAMSDSLKKVFISSGKGCRNTVMLVVVAYMKNIMKLEREEFIMFVNRWNHAVDNMIRVDEYIYNWDTYSHVDENGKKYVHGKILQDFVDEFGYVDFRLNFNKDKQQKIRIKSRENEKIYINLRVFNKEIIKKMKHNSLKLLLLFIYENYVHHKDEWTQENFLKHKYYKISKPTLISCLDELVDFGFISKSKMFKGDRDYTYSLTALTTELYTKNIELSFAGAQRLIRELEGNNLKGFLLLKSFVVMNDMDSIENLTIAKLSEMMGYKTDGFKKLTKALDKGEFIRIIDNGYKKCNSYELLL